MCGIFGYVSGKENSPKTILTGLRKLEYRGYDSWGIAVISKNKIFVKKKVGKIGSANVDSLPKGPIAFGHTRWATHGGITDINAHPHFDCSKETAVIHNGIFENYEEVKKELIKKGHKFVSETDTEVVSHMIEDGLKESSLPETFRKVFNRMEGLNAVIAINAKERLLVAARNGSPLIVGFGKDKNFLASDTPAILPYTKSVYFLEDNEMTILSDKSVKVIDVKSGKVKKINIQKIDWDIQQEKLGKYKHFMLKEIYEQPKIIADIATSGKGQAEKIANIIKNAKGSYLVGCGTASYACMAGTYLFSKIAKFHINSAVGSEFGYHLEFLNKKSLVIALSQSGETMDILESVKKAKEKGAKIVSLVNVLGSSLYRLSDYKTLIGAGPEKAVASTKAFTGMIAHLLLIAYSLDDRAPEGQKVLKEAAESTKKVLSKKEIEKIKKLAGIIKDKKHIYVIGRGLSYPTSLEAALKIKEISYIHAEGLAAGELKHGPLALVEKGTPCIAFLPNDETYGSNLAGAMEMKARGGFIVGISHKDHEVFDYYIPVADVKEATIIPNIVASQLLAYFLTIKKGLDPDKPRNLAKSVTVK